MSQTPVILFIVVLLAVFAHHLWRSHNRLLMLVPLVIAYELVKMNFPVASTIFAHAETALGLTPTSFAQLVGALLLLLIVSFAFKRLFMPPHV